jgi:defect in organelle trafficking protein DotB
MTRVSNVVRAERKTEYSDPQRFTLETEFKALILESLAHKASDIFIQPGTPVYGKINGELRGLTYRDVDQSEVETILKWVCGRENAAGKIMGGEAQNGRYEVFPRQITIDHRGNRLRYGYRVNAVTILSDGALSCQIVIRAIPADPPDFRAVGMTEDIIHMMTPKDGIVLIAGATGSGKTTTFASVIRYILENNTPIRGNLVTYEEPIEFVYASIPSDHSVIVQTEVPSMCESFAEGIKQAMRRAPRLIMVGELRDEETIQSAIEASMTGHPVFATVHANNVAGVMKRLVSRYPENLRSTAIFDIIENCRFIMAQRLVRTVTGGLTAAREYLQFTAAMREELQELTNMGQLTTRVGQLVRDHGNSFEAEARRLVAAGLIREEVARALIED